MMFDPKPTPIRETRRPLMRLRTAFNVGLAGLIAVGCSGDPLPGLAPFDPEIDDLRPQILPIDGLIAEVMGDSGRFGDQSPDFGAAMETRVAALKRRAAILRGAPVNETTRRAIATR